MVGTWLVQTANVGKRVFKGKGIRMWQRLKLLSSDLPFSGVPMAIV